MLDLSARLAVFLVCQIMCKRNFAMKIRCLKSSHKSYPAESVNELGPCGILIQYNDCRHLSVCQQ